MFERLADHEAAQRKPYPISGGVDVDPPADPPADPPPADPPAPEYATRADFQRLESIISGQQELIASQSAMLQQAIRSQAQPPARPPSDDLTDEQLDSMLDEGRITRSQHARMIAKREIGSFKTAEIDPMRETGVNALSESAFALAKDRMPFYTKYKAEIDKVVETIPKAQRTSADIYVTAHNIVVGQHATEIADAAREEAIRSKGAPPPETPSPTTRTGRNTRTDQVPTVEEAMGRDAALALEARGLTPDAFAKKLGYADWKTYAKLAEGQAAGSV